MPFVGRSGQRLDAAIREIGLTDGSFGVLNLLKCRPPENRFDRAAARACRPFLDRQLALLRPEVLVSLGAHALRSLDPAAPSVSNAAGRFRPRRTVPLFPMLHPAASLRSRRWAEQWAHDVGAFRRWWSARASQRL